MPIVFKYVYRSTDDSVGRMGIGGTHSYDYRVWKPASSPPENNYWYILPNNSRYLFVGQPDGTYVNTNEDWLAGARLYDSRVTGPSRYALRFKDGTVFQFASDNGYLRFITDPNHNMLELVLDPAGSMLTSEIRQPGGRSIKLSYMQFSTQWCVTNATDNTGRSVNYSYDAAGRLTNVTTVSGGNIGYTYDNPVYALSNLCAVTRPDGVVETRIEYNGEGRVWREIFADGGTNLFTYATNAVSGIVTQTVVRDVLGNTTTYNFSTYEHWTGSINAAGTNTYVRDTSNGSLLQATDPLGRTTSYVRDSNNNIVAITNAQNKVTKFSYTSDFNRLSSVIDPLGRTNSFGYDANGNLISTINALGKVTTITYSAFGLPLSVVDPLTNTYTFTYNETLDLASVRDPLGNEVQRIVDALGRPIGLTDAYGRTTRIEYGPPGCGACGSNPDLPVSITDPINGITRFGYDVLGNLTNVTDALSHSVGYGYDAMKRMTLRTDQLSKQEIYRYDKHGNVTNFVDRRGVSVNFKYDALERRTGVVYAANDSVRYFYDKVGRVTNVTDSLAGTIKLTYDSLDRLTQENNNNGTVSYGYNDVGLRTNMTVSGETAVFYRYDNANRLTNVTQGTFTTSLYYDDAGRRTNLTLPNGIKVLYRYDNASRLTNITYQGAITNRIDYSYDEAGNRVAQVSPLANYLLPGLVTNSTYNAANQQLTFGSYSMLYDADGNVTNIVNGTTTNRLAWSARNQLTNLTGAVTAFFLYDGLGRRITRTVGSTTERYLYDGLDIILQKNSGGTVQGRYLRGLAIDEPWQRIDVGAANTNRIYLADALGSIVALTDTNRVIQTEYDYQPFGVTTNMGAANKNSYKFTAREEDGTGLYYYRARYYHPSLARFMKEDPAEMVNPANLYAYVGDSPLEYFDPLGLKACYKSGQFSIYSFEQTRWPSYVLGGVGIFEAWVCLCQWKCCASATEERESLRRTGIETLASRLKAAEKMAAAIRGDPSKDWFAIGPGNDAQKKLAEALKATVRRDYAKEASDFSQQCAESCGK